MTSQTAATRPASPKALGFLDALLRDRNLAASPTFADATSAMDPQELANYVDGIKARAAQDAAFTSKLIDALKQLPFNPIPASEAQIALIRKSAAKKGDEQFIADLEAKISGLTGGREGTASKLIDELFAMPFRNLPPVNLPQVPAGRYAVDNADGVLTFYVIRVKQDGKVVINVKASNVEHEVPFNAAGYATILQSILDAGLREATIRYGQELGHCGVCGRELTDETSRAEGIGPVCATRF